ncbi:MAG TPA: hypothetical protein VFM13_04935 [Gaiellaceae bacterium]|nr:hypothetical protein [Gaiellaceae bacterium]
MLDGHEVPAYEHVAPPPARLLIVEKMTRALRKAVRRSDPRTDRA